MSVAIGYVPGAFGQGGDNPNYLRELVELGDRYGYDSIWLSDRIVSDRFSLEPVVALSMVAAYSDRLKFGTSVLALPLRNPVVLAKQIATLDYLSQGRFLPAVGLGQEEPEEYEACGVPKEDRAQRTDEAIVLMRRLWQEDVVTHETAGKPLLLRAPCHVTRAQVRASLNFRAAPCRCRRPDSQADEGPPAQGKSGFQKNTGPGLYPGLGTSTFYRWAIDIDDETVIDIGRHFDLFDRAHIFCKG